MWPETTVVRKPSLVEARESLGARGFQGTVDGAAVYSRCSLRLIVESGAHDIKGVKCGSHDSSRDHRGTEVAQNSFLEHARGKEPAFARVVRGQLRG